MPQCSQTCGISSPSVIRSFCLVRTLLLSWGAPSPTPCVASTGHRAVMARARAPGRSGVVAGARGSRLGALQGRPSQAISTRGDGGGREPAGIQMLESDVEVVATWAGFVRVVAL